jgi:hypothetical protein
MRYGCLITVPLVQLGYCNISYRPSSISRMAQLISTNVSRYWYACDIYHVVVVRSIGTLVALTRMCVVSAGKVVVSYRKRGRFSRQPLVALGSKGRSILLRAFRTCLFESKHTACQLPTNHTPMLRRDRYLRARRLALHHLLAQSRILQRCNSLSITTWTCTLHQRLWVLCHRARTSCITNRKRYTNSTAYVCFRLWYRMATGPFTLRCSTTTNTLCNCWLPDAMHRRNRRKPPPRYLHD